MKNIKRILTLCLIVFCISILMAQEDEKPAEKPAEKSAEKGTIDTKTDPASEYNEADRPEENYLARFHALDRVEKLMRTNLEKIYILNVVTTNFKKDFSDWEADYKKIFKGYKDGVDLFYRRKVIYSRWKLEKNHKEINLFNKKIFNEYRKKCLELLDQCADTILELTLDARTSADPNKNKALFINKMRIRVAYGQLDDAERAANIDNVYHTAVAHLRVCKKYSIKILEQLNPNKYKTDQYKKEFNIHKADSKNRIWVDKVTTAKEVDVVQ